MKAIYLIHNKKWRIILLNLIFTLIGFINPEVIVLTDNNFDRYISTYELVCVNFHAEWCHFSQRLVPILKQTDDIILKEFKEPNRVLFGRVDCDENPILSTRYKIAKYPTLKFFLNGKAMKKEYRGQRTEEALVKHLRDLLTDPVVHTVYESLPDLSAIMYNKSAIIGYYKESPERHPKYKSFRRVASDLRGFCDFFWVTNFPYIPDGKQELLAFKSSKSTKQSEYDFVFETYDELSTWSTFLCIPIVREITFDNAEEIIEEGLPLVILLHKPDDQNSVDHFRDVVHKELISETSNVNFITADADIFAHPLSRIGKTKQDLPLIVIDSFKHMYLFPKFEELNKSHILANIISDLHSGKLHREYHFGVETETEIITQEMVTEMADKAPAEEEVQSVDQGLEYEEDDTEAEVLTPVADSVFKNLGPSVHRYTLLKDEL